MRAIAGVGAAGSITLWRRQAIDYQGDDTKRWRLSAAVTARAAALATMTDLDPKSVGGEGPASAN
jgi:hypothetical protein